MKAFAVVVLIVVTLVGVVSCEMSLWQECRKDHSWFYCMRVLNK